MLLAKTGANTGTAVGDFGTIVRTTNGGATWVAQNSGTRNLLRGVSFSDATTGTAVGSGGTILRTAAVDDGCERVLVTPMRTKNREFPTATDSWRVSSDSVFPRRRSRVGSGSTTTKTTTSSTAAASMISRQVPMDSFLESMAACVA